MSFTESEVNSTTRYSAVDERRPKRMSVVRILLWISLALLIIDGGVEMGLIAKTVDWLITLTFSRRIYAVAPVQYQGQTLNYISAVPTELNVNTGHLANGAAGTAVILVGFGGIGALCLRDKKNFSTSLFSKMWYHTWLVIVTLSMLLTLSSLVYSFYTLAQTNNEIDFRYFSPSNDYIKYSKDYWSPKTWFDALLTLPLSSDTDRTNISRYAAVVTGWMYNQIPLFILSFTVFVLAIIDGVNVWERMQHEHEAVAEYKADVA